MGTPLHLAWRQQYRNHPYARHLSDAELKKRTHDLILNLLRVTPEAKIGVFSVDQSFGPMWEKFTHMLEEMKARNWPGIPRDLYRSEPFPDFASKLAKAAAKRMTGLSLKRGDVFIRLGRQTHMSDLHRLGRLRIQPASYLAEPSLNQAVRDDELSLSFSFAVVHDDTGNLVPYSARNADANEGRLDVRFDRHSDYYLYCVTASVEPRLPVDFNAEACVIIRNRDAFCDRLRRAMVSHDPSLEMHEGPVIYVDPLLPASTRPFVPLSKYFGYAYQDEYRFCWLPPSRVPRLSPIDIEIGSLEDISELILLETD